MKKNTNNRINWDAFEDVSEIRNSKTTRNGQQGANERVNLLDIISKARQNMNQVNKTQWHDPNSEEEILKDAQAKGKSPYDADVLRQTILKRQAEKRAVSSMSGFLDAVKKKKDDYDK